MTTVVADHWSPLALEAALAAAGPPFLLDVREFPEFATGHLKGAHLLPLAEIERRAGDLPKNHQIVAVCRSGRRSAEAAMTLARLGFANVGQLTGGLEAWEQAGLPTEREERAPWALERQVRLVAGILILLGLGFSHIWPVAIMLAWFVPLGLIIAALTDSCLMGTLLAKLPWNRDSRAACQLPKS